MNELNLHNHNNNDDTNDQNYNQENLIVAKFDQAPNTEEEKEA